MDLRTHPLIETLSQRLKTAEKYMSVFFVQFKEKYDCESWAYFFFCLNISRTFSPLFFRFSPFFFRFFAFLPFLSFQLICSFFARISQLREEYIILAILGSNAQIFLILQKMAARRKDFAVCHKAGYTMHNDQPRRFSVAC